MRIASLAFGLTLAAVASVAVVRAAHRAPEPVASSGVAPRPVATEDLESPLPLRLVDTGIGGPDVLTYSPQYPLWSDGATKRRFVRFPPGAAIHVDDGGEWMFPVGTKLWKEFSFGTRVETRFIERTGTGFRFATYAFAPGDDDPAHATLAPARGAATEIEVAHGRTHRIPGVGDCHACHGSGKPGEPSPVLGLTALQLSTDRDPLAPHAEPLRAGDLTLASLVARGLLRGYDKGTAPRIAARTPIERAALGTLYGNCSGCHRPGRELASLDMSFSIGADGVPRGLATVIGVPSKHSPGVPRVAPGRPAMSLLLTRMGSRAAALQMPPLGTERVDDESLALVTRWITELPSSSTEQHARNQGSHP